MLICKHCSQEVVKVNDWTFDEQHNIIIDDTWSCDCSVYGSDDLEQHTIFVED